LAASFFSYFSSNLSIARLSVFSAFLAAAAALPPLPLLPEHPPPQLLQPLWYTGGGGIYPAGIITGEATAEAEPPIAFGASVSEPAIALRIDFNLSSP